MRSVEQQLNRWVAQFGSITRLLIVVTVVVFVLQLVCDLFRLPYLNLLFALSGPGLRLGFVWQPVTYLFLHGGFWHLLVNLLVLWFFGREVEFFIGPKSFTRLYFIGGLMGAALHLAFNWASPVPVMGASAAVLGCVVAFATLFPDREVTLLVFFILPVNLKAKYLALIAVAFDAVAVLSGTTSNVAHLAHLGGAAFGYFYIRHLGYGRPLRWLAWTSRIKVRRDPKSAAEFISQEVDPILDKIAREGMQSLTSRERKILDSARDLLQKRHR